MTDPGNPRAHLDQYAAALRDLRDAAPARASHVTLPPGLDPRQAAAVLDRLGRLAAEDGFDQMAAAIAGTLTAHLPFVTPEQIGAVLLDLSQFMLSFIDHPDPASVPAATDLPVIVALVGQEMYSGGGR